MVTSLSGGAAAGCGPDSSCEDVLTSKWAYIGSIPVSGLAIPVYLVIFWNLVCRLRGKSQFQWLGNGAALVTVVSALYFFLIQLAVIKSFCPFCLTTHVCASIAGVLGWRNSVRHVPGGSPGLAYSVVLAIWGIGILAQVLAPNQPGTSINQEPVVTPPTPEVIQETGNAEQVAQNSNSDSEGEAIGPDSAPANRDRKSRMASTMGLDVEGLPLIGLESAKRIEIVLVDYTCKYCRRLHADLIDMTTKSPDRVAFLMAPMPLDSECNNALARRGFQTQKSHIEACEISRLALALNRVSPAAFMAWDRDLMHRPEFPNYRLALTAARKLVNPQLLSEAIRSPWVSQQIAASSAIYESHYTKFGKGSMPQLVINGSPHFTPLSGSKAISLLKASYPGEF